MKLDNSIQNIAASILRFASRHRTEFRFVSNLLPLLRNAAKTREEFEQSGIHIPPILIAGIASHCNPYPQTA